MWHLDTCTVAGRRLNHARSPNTGAASVTFIHGVLRSWDYGLPLLGQLASRYELFGLDQRGHGRSDRADRYLVVDYVDDAAAWLRQCVRRPSIVYGHSLGAMVAAGVAAQCPDLVRGVVLEDPPFETLGRTIGTTGFLNYFRQIAELISAPKSTGQIARGLGEITFTVPATGRSHRLKEVRDLVSLRYMAASLTRIDPRVLEPLISGDWLEGFDEERVFAGLRCPVLLLQADEAAGGMLMTDAVERMKRLAADVTHVRLPDVGHAMHWQRTMEIANLTVGFIESLDE